MRLQPLDVAMIRRHPVSQIAPFLLPLPVFSVLGGVFFLGERPAPAPA